MRSRTPHDALAPRTSAADLSVRVDEVSSFFDRYDPAPLGERALSPGATDHLLSRVELLSAEAPVSLKVFLPQGSLLDSQAVIDGVRAHFRREAERQRRLTRRLIATGWRMMLTGVVVAVALVGVAQLLAEISELRVVQTVANGISIVVWVILWRPAETLIYDWRPLRESRVRCERLAEGEIVIAELPPRTET